MIVFYLYWHFFEKIAMKKNPFHLPFYEIFFYPISSNSLSPSIDGKEIMIFFFINIDAQSPHLIFIKVQKKQWYLDIM